MITKLQVALETPMGRDLHLCRPDGHQCCGPWVGHGPETELSRYLPPSVSLPQPVSSTSPLQLPSCFSTLLHSHLKKWTGPCHFHFQHLLRTPTACNLNLNSSPRAICAIFSSCCLSLLPMFQLPPTTHQTLSITLSLYFAQRIPQARLSTLLLSPLPQSH